MEASGNPRVLMFWEHVPRPFMENVLRCLFDVYITADDHCGTHFEKEEAADIRPFVRRAFLEGAIRDVAKTFPDVVATAAVNATGNWHHTRVLCGRVALTQNALGDPADVVRPSLFRSMYAAKDNQKYLLPELEPAESPPDSLLYGILVHGRSDTSHLFPGFADVVFPKPDLASYYDGRIKLFTEFPEIVKAKTSRFFGTEETVEPTQPVLRVRKKGTGG